MLVHGVIQVQVPANVLCTSQIYKLFVVMSLCVCMFYWKVREQRVQKQILFITVKNFRCVNNFSNMGFFLVIIHNLEFASTDMLDLCAKYLIGMLNYTPCPHIITLPLFSIEHNVTSLNLRRVLSSLL
jgi:hypothetical protein